MPEATNSRELLSVDFVRYSLLAAFKFSKNHASWGNIIPSENRKRTPLEKRGIESWNEHTPYHLISNPAKNIDETYNRLFM